MGFSIINAKSINCFQLLPYEIFYLCSLEGEVQLQEVQYHNVPMIHVLAYSSVRHAQFLCMITQRTQNVPPKHCHLQYWLINQTSTVFWNSGHCPLSMTKSTQCLTGWLYPCLNVKCGKDSTYPGQPITNSSVNHWDFNHPYDLLP